MIGFCEKQFSLEGRSLGYERNSIGLWDKKGIYIGGSEKKFGNGIVPYEKGEFAGIGLVLSPANSTIQCFSTLNGELLGNT